MDEKIAWMQKMLRACGHIEEYTQEEKEIVFLGIHQEFNTFSADDKMIVESVLKEQMDAKDFMYVLSILIKNGAADQWIPLVLQLAESIKLNRVVRSMIEVQLNAISHNRYLEVREFHKNTVAQWANAIPIFKNYTDIEKRNQNRIVIVTEQLISELHAPTKVVLQTAYVLQHIMGYEVLLVSLPCNAGKIGEIWYDSYVMNSDSEYEDEPIIRKYKDEVFFGYQVSMKMRNVRDYSMLISYILEWNPLFVFSMGTTNPVADILINYTTVVAQSMSTFMAVSEAQILIDIGNNDEIIQHLRQMVIRFDEVPRYFGEAKEIHTREKYGIKENQFVCAVVGNRLGKEVDSAFIDFMKKVTERNKNVAFAFVGAFEKGQELIENGIPKDQLFFLGYCNDLLGLYKIMDLYVNPDRMGGGFSSAMALTAGVPVLSINHGDVLKQVGKTFCVENYDEMSKEIEKYIQDSAYREEKVKMAMDYAKERTEEKMIQALQKNLLELINIVKTSGNNR